MGIELIVVTVLVSAAAGARGEEPSDLTLAFDEATLALATRLGSDQPPPEAVPEATDAAAEPVLGEFSKTRWFWNAYGSAIFGDSGKGEMYLAHLGFGYYIGDYHSLSLDFFGGYIRSGIDDDGGAIGVDLLYRIHLVHSEDDKSTFFIDGGVGIQQQSTNFSGERHFNFRVMFGIGGSLRIGDNSRLFGGARYIHISDAGVRGGGGGFDGPMLWAGFAFPF